MTASSRSCCGSTGGVTGTVDPFLAGFGFLPALPRREAAAALRNRTRLLRAVVDSHRFALASEWMQQTKPAHVAWMFELVVARLEAEIAWCERVAERIEGGARLFPEGMATLVRRAGPRDER